MHDHEQVRIYKSHISITSLTDLLGYDKPVQYIERKWKWLLIKNWLSLLILSCNLLLCLIKCRPIRAQFIGWSCASSNIYTSLGKPLNEVVEFVFEIFWNVRSISQQLVLWNLLNFSIVCCQTFLGPLLIFLWCAYLYVGSQVDKHGTHNILVTCTYINALRCMHMARITFLWCVYLYLHSQVHGNDTHNFLVIL